ncbi:DUF2157 domain-containing protein [Paraflavitalea pollutisoli]|uniref:DUF2157 domain-containing protein n=1 Tax=Paraflavitalea pollutisoli TaxID=3034143 RepID=UPI0023EBBA20|nr:DUF2157 domain-containing protein [Paraflavitalea sp. H1-2-19X]
MPQPDREDIHLISQLTDWSAASADQALETYVYQDKTTWRRFLPLFCLLLGVGLTVAGILFFFAYNWADLHKFAKLGLIEGLLTLLVLLVIGSKLSLTVKKTLLTGAGMLVGVLFAVFGQVYQTGADAYDLFLAWTLGITLWVFIIHFAPMWLLYILLCNITMTLYGQQVSSNWSGLWYFTLLFLLDALFIVIALLIGWKKPSLRLPDWSILVVALGAATLATLGGIMAIYDPFRSQELLIYLAVMIPTYTTGIWYGYRYKKFFYLAALPFSLIVLGTALLLKQSYDTGMLFFIFLFVVASVTGLVWWLIRIQRQLSHEKN